MLLKEKMTRLDLLDYLYQFDERYGDALDNTEIRYIFDNCELGNHKDIVPYILNQFYSEFNLVDENKNIYISLLKKLKEDISLDKKRILEVGGGPTPQLGRLLAKEAKEVTVMDTTISIKNNQLDNLHLEQQYFLPYTDISKYDLVVAFMVCGTAESIIYNCTKNDKDFFIGLCPCGRKAVMEIVNKKLTDQEYINGVIDLAKKRTKENNMGILKEDYLQDQPLYKFPIIYNKRCKIINYKRDVF